MDEFSIEQKIEDLENQLRELKKSLKKSNHLVSDYIFPQTAMIEGVKFSSINANIKSKEKLDLTLIEIREGSSIAGVFTKSETRSSPVRWCEKVLAMRREASLSGKVGILINSGNANTFTGKIGEKTVMDSVASVSKYLGCERNNVFIASTGVIGEVLPSEKIMAKIPALCKNLSSGDIAGSAQAIMTTDTFPKGFCSTVTIEGVKVSIAGIAKGSGMIAPDMATMLGFVFTDISIDEDLLQKTLSDSVDKTFNSISVDSDMSTSDTVILAATGRASGLHFSSAQDKGYDEFSYALISAMKALSHLIVKDGEGATKFVKVKVSGADTYASAKIVSKSIANSPLVKTAISGEDPNWGRIIMAIGKSGEKINRDRITVKFGKILVAENGWVAPSYSEELGASYMKNDELEINVDLGVGSQSATCYTCDFSHDYISINADYRS